MAAAVQTLGADSRVRIEETVKLRLLAQRLGATPRELESVCRTISGSATAGSGVPGGEHSRVETGAHSRACVPHEPDAGQWDAPLARLAPFTGAQLELSAASRLATAWLPPPLGTTSEGVVTARRMPAASGHTGGDGGGGGASFNGAAHRPLASRDADEIGLWDPSGSGSHAPEVREALQEKLSLQEKLRKVCVLDLCQHAQRPPDSPGCDTSPHPVPNQVRSTFASIRQEVYDS